jgi:hypothetical protein
MQLTEKHKEDVALARKHSETQGAPSITRLEGLEDLSSRQMRWKDPHDDQEDQECQAEEDDDHALQPGQVSGLIVKLCQSLCVGSVLTQCSDSPKRCSQRGQL